MSRSRKTSACFRFVRSATLLALVLATALLAAGPAAADHPGERVTGTVVTDHADTFSGGSAKPRPLFTIKTKRGERRLRFRRTVSRRRLRASSNVTLRGRVKGRSIRVDRLGRARARVRARAAAYVGDRRTAVVLMSFATSPNAFTHAAARLKVFDDAPGSPSADAYFREVSDGDIALVGRDNPAAGDVYGPYVVTAGTGCPDSTWKAQATNLANAAGAHLVDYQHVIYVLPPQSGCGWLGLGSVGGTWSMMRNTLDTSVVAHELGHNLYLDHAASQSCEIGNTPVTLSESCSTDEYGDPFDAMGNHPEGRLYNASHRFNSGWVTNAQSRTIAQDGTYQLGALALDEATRVLRIPRGDSSGTELQLEIRRAFGLFDDFDPGSAVTQGLSVRIAAPPPKYALTRLLDMTPSSSSFHDSALAVGKTFYDPVSSTSVRLDSLGPLGATVTVDLDMSPEQEPPSVPATSAPPPATPPVFESPPQPDLSPVARLTFLPRRVLAIGGSRGRGSAARLHRSDGRVFAVRARRGVARFEARFSHVTSGKGRMRLTLRGKASASCRGAVELYVPGSRRWSRVARLSLGRRSRTMALSAPGAGTRYISRGGTVRVRVSCGARRLRTVSADLLRLSTG